MGFTKATSDYLDAGGIIKWITTPKTSAFTAVSGEGYLVDTTSAAITVTLPTSPSEGDEIIITDYASNAGTNNITLDPGTLNLRGATDDFVMSTNNQSVRLLYSGATKGWLVTTEAGGGAAAAADITVDFLVVAGGGAGGGAYYGGGGGAGGLRTSYGSTSGGGASAETSLTFSAATEYNLSVGSGGTGVSQADGNDGGDSFIRLDTTDMVRSIGGGGGGGGGTSSTSANYGRDGGSGGGYSLFNNGTYAGGAGTSGQGYAGSSQAISGYSSAGGGAAEAGHTADADAGDGLAVNIISATNAGTASVGEVVSSSVYFAGGGGGSTSSNSNTAAAGGLGGGGEGGRYMSYQNNVAPIAGAANTGGGGGGGVHAGTYTGASGGSGVIILRYPSSNSITVGSGIVESTGSPFTEGASKISVFTGGSGTFTFS